MRLSHKQLLKYMNKKPRTSTIELAAHLGISNEEMTHIRESLRCSQSQCEKITEKLNCQVTDIERKQCLGNDVIDAKKHLLQFKYGVEASREPYRRLKTLSLEYIKSHGIDKSKYEKDPYLRNEKVNKLLEMEGLL